MSETALTEAHTPAAEPQNTTAPAGDVLLSVRGLSTRFRTERGTVMAVDNVSFDVHSGETVAIVGESGSGKSVTALSLLRLIPNPPGEIVSGEIVFDGQDLLKLDDAGIRAIRGNRIAMISGAHVLAQSGHHGRAADW